MNKKRMGKITQAGSLVMSSCRQISFCEIVSVTTKTVGILTRLDGIRNTYTNTV
jgi:hypothetical protein